MLSTLSEKTVHAIRWGIFLAWCLLIVSLFYDPVSAVLTNPENSWSWLADDKVAIANNPATCIYAQRLCIPLEPYAVGTRVFWGMVIPGAIFIVLVFGHEFWRRLCPLYFFSQLPRALKMKPLLNIEQNTWLQQNHFYVQFILFYLGITARILFVNSLRPAAGLFFILTLLAAAGVVALYGGRSWCHYICPFGMVQTVFTGPGGLLASQAHTAKPYSITQSMCREIDTHGEEQSACVSCKANCMDIDAEQAYWAQLHKPGRKLVQYGYLGLVVGYFTYYCLYAGNFGYYFSGVWSYEPWRVSSLLKPGFYLFQQPIAIPKLFAAPLTLAVFAMVSCWICTGIERFYRGYLKRNNPAGEADQGLHRLFSVCTFLAFNFFFVYGGRPEINNLPVAFQFGFQSMIAIVSSLWLYKTWDRSASQYQQESMADRQRRLIGKLPLDIEACLDGETLQQIDPKQIDILAKILPQLVENLETTAGSQDNADIPLPATVMRKGKSNRLGQVQLMNAPKTHIRKK